jgi:hypothetical protein
MDGMRAGTSERWRLAGSKWGEEKELLDVEDASRYSHS